MVGMMDPFDFHGFQVYHIVLQTTLCSLFSIRECQQFGIQRKCEQSLEKITLPTNICCLVIYDTITRN